MVTSLVQDKKMVARRVPVRNTVNRRTVCKGWFTQQHMLRDICVMQHVTVKTFQKYMLHLLQSVACNMSPRLKETY